MMTDEDEDRGDVWWLMMMMMMKHSSSAKPIKNENSVESSEKLERKNNANYKMEEYSKNIMY